MITKNDYLLGKLDYPQCPKCDSITYPTFDQQTVKPYLKCYSCGYNSRKAEGVQGSISQE